MMNSASAKTNVSGNMFSAAPCGRIYSHLLALPALSLALNNATFIHLSRREEILNMEAICFLQHSENFVCSLSAGLL